MVFSAEDFGAPLIDPAGSSALAISSQPIEVRNLPVTSETR